MGSTEPARRGGLSGARSAPAIDGQAAFVAVRDGVFRLETPLTFATVPLLRMPGLQRIAASSGALEFDLERVVTVDSAGLALLVDWLAEARRQQRSLRYGQPPEALRQLAQLSEVESLIADRPDGAAAQPSTSGGGAARQ